MVVQPPHANPTPLLGKIQQFEIHHFKLPLLLNQSIGNIKLYLKHYKEHTVLSNGLIPSSNRLGVTPFLGRGSLRKTV